MEHLHLIYQSLLDVQNDFIGFSFHPSAVIVKLTQFLSVVLLFFIMYLLGRLIDRIFFTNAYEQRLRPFVRFALGYILLSTTIFFLGLFGLLTEVNVILVLCISIGVGLLDLLKNPLRISVDKKIFKFDLIKYIGLFILLAAFLRMLPPEPAGDPLDYHLRFPRIYLFEHTMMLPPLGDESYITVPQLPEMLFIPSQIFTNGEMSRAINFGFFVLIYSLLYSINIVYKKEKKLGPLSAVFFAINPLVFKITSSAFSDYPALFCMIVSTYILLERKKVTKSVIVSGLLAGGALASKLWMLLYFPFYVLFLFVLLIKERLKTKIKMLLLFLASAILIVSPWYIRGIILAGNPFYVNTNQGQPTESYSLLEGILAQNNPQHLLFGKYFFNAESGMTYIGIILIFFFYKIIYKNSNKAYLKLVFIVLIASFFVPVDFALGRYSLPYILPLYTLIAFALAIIFKKTLGKIIIFTTLLAISGYYFFNSLVILPYGLGWANADTYLQRNLLKSKVSYYDFNHTFAKAIKPNELIATYGMYELYYATFRYKNIYYFYNQTTHELKIPTDKIDKLLIRGGDFDWFCSKVKITNCNNYRVVLLTSDNGAQLYLYKIVRSNQL